MQTETKRIESFSDGVFAVAITLLILEIKAPRATAGNLAHALAEDWPSYLAFVLSFFYIGVMWIDHHRVFAHIRRSNDTLVILNLLLLLGVSAAPFPTGLLATNLGTPDQRTAQVLYDAVFLAITTFFNVLWRYALSRQLIDKSLSASAATISRVAALGPWMYAACLALAYVNVWVSLFFNIVLAIFFALPLDWVRKSMMTERRDESHANDEGHS